MPQVKDLMTKKVLVTTSSKTALEAAKLMTEEGRGSIVIVDDGKPVGILTERDFLRKVVAGNLTPSTVYVKDIMSVPLVTIDPDESVKNAARLMLEQKIRRLVVVKDNNLVGILASTDFAKHLGKKGITEGVLDAIARSYPNSYIPPPC